MSYVSAWPRGRSHVPEVIPCDRRLLTLAASSSESVATRPPSPTDSTLFEKKLKQPSSPHVPSFRPRHPALGACAASSINAMLRASQSSRNSSTADAYPP